MITARRSLCTILFHSLVLVPFIAAGAPLGPRPQKCQPEGCWGGDFGPNVLDNTFVGEVSVSPPVLKKGQVLTVNVAAYHENGSISVTAPGEPLSDCPPSRGSFTCQYKMNEPTADWTEVQVSIGSPFGTGREQEAFYVHGRNSHFISGRITSLPVENLEEGVGIRQMKVKVVRRGRRRGNNRRGRTFRRTVTTDDSGYYLVRVNKPGKYRVTAERRDSDIALNADIDSPKTARVTRSRDAEVDFELGRGNELEFEIRDAAGAQISQITTNGLTQGELYFKGIDPNDGPLSNAEIVLFVNQAGNNGTPKALVCNSDGGSREWPNVLSNRPDWNDPIADDFRLNDSGEASLKVFFGTEPGTFSITTNLASEPTKIEGGDVAVSTEPAGSLSPSIIGNQLLRAVSQPFGVTTVRLDDNAPFSFHNALTSNARNATPQFMEALSRIRAAVPGIEFVPIKNNGGTTDYTVAAYPSGSVVLGENDALNLPPGSFVFDPVSDGFSALMQFSSQTGNIVAGSSFNALPSVEDWANNLGSNGVIGWFGGSGGEHGLLYAGAPYLSTELAAGGAMRNCLR